MTRNIENINIMIDTFIRLDKSPLPEHPDKGFNMADYEFEPRSYTQHNCGTAACLIGWSEIIFSKQDIDKVFGINYQLACSLHSPSENRRHPCSFSFAIEPEKFTLRAAIRVLQILRDTGEVNWNEAIANPWTPDEEQPAKSWVKALLLDGNDMPVPLIEGPKRTVKSETK